MDHSSKSPVRDLTKKSFANYITSEEATEGIKSGKLQKGVLYINQKFTKHSFVQNEDPSKPNFTMTSFTNRNRALDRDVVVLKIENKEAEVVHISKKIHPRTAVGYLKPKEDDENFALFCPRDKRVPKIEIHKTFLPINFAKDAKKFSDILFFAQITMWDTRRKVRGKIIEMLGVTGNLKAETLAILREFCIAPSICYNLLLELSLCNRVCLPREVLRRRCVFTIDNEDTKNMDDALSCQELPNGNYEVGVHISDVSHYLTRGTSLDQAAMMRATSVYLVNTCYNMLPDEVLDLCSLQPGKEKLTFSIFFEITPFGQVVNTRGAKTVINSCCRLTYKDAQMLIDHREAILPSIYHNFQAQDLQKAVSTLHFLASLIRHYRKEKFGVKRKRSSVSFRLDQTGSPVELMRKEMLQSQNLVEEFMILTNVTVAQKIHPHFPNLAILRVHETTNVKKVSRTLESVGVHVNFSSAKELQKSLDKYVCDTNLGHIYEAVLNRLITKVMSKQAYICTGAKTTNFSHFGLGFPLYTHFTSPLRRYADVMTHRLLSGCLKYTPFNWKLEDVCEVVETCNRQEFQARKAQEASFDLYLSHFIDRHQPFVTDAVVYKVKEQSFDVVVFTTGSSVRIFTDTFEESWRWKSERISSENITSKWRMKIKFPKTETNLIIDVFTVVKVELAKAPKANRLKARLWRP